jgi:hypothetical protein
MIEKLFNSLKDIDIRIYTLTSGKTLIGECAEAYEDGVELHCALEIKKLLVKSGVYSEVMMPLVAGNDSEPCIVYDKSIETESFACDDVKRKYAEALVYNRLCQMMDERSLEQDLKEEYAKENLEKSFPELDKQKQPLSQEELLNIFLERWKQ